MTTTETILTRVAESFEVNMADLSARKKTARLVIARQTAIYLIRKLTDLTLCEIGQIFNRHHATIMHSWEQVHRRASVDDRYALKVAGLETELKSAYN